MVNKVVPEQHAETHPSVKYFFREMPDLGFGYTNLTFSFYISTYLI